MCKQKNIGTILHMNKYDHAEKQAAELVYIDATRHVNSYANLIDRPASTIALLLRALELAGGKDFIKPMEIE